MLLSLIVVLTVYLFLLTALTIGWYKMIHKTNANPVSSSLSLITVIVPFRNEAHCLPSLINSLALLNYPEEKFEVVLVNDHSEDESAQALGLLIRNRPNFRQLDLGDNEVGKKMALTKGIELGVGEIIVTTDADCRVPGDWLAQINNAMQSKSTQMVFGGVKFDPTNSFFARLQAMEFASLIGSGAASIGLGYFTMCNGANLAFRKSAFVEVGGYDGNFGIPSGDDEFLASKILTKYPGSVKFLKERDAVVGTLPQPTVNDFINQRLRWAGKWKFNKSWLTKLVALAVLFTQIVFVCLVVSLFRHNGNEMIVASLIMIKFFLEGAFLYSVYRFLEVRWSWVSFFVLQFIYPLYVIGIGIVSQGRYYDWKGRRLSHKV